GVFIFGINAERVLQKTVQRVRTRTNPAHIPKLKGIALQKPFLLPLDMAMMLFGPGVMAVITA
ncbi:MAG: hypothetical protein IJF43_06110, partial [Firmicutes bacterium]|nr:hypothetical protein [Bacillota bacterium]